VVIKAARLAEAVAVTEAVGLAEAVGVTETLELAAVLGLTEAAGDVEAPPAVGAGDAELGCATGAVLL
jgi:hypothetical protein